MLDTGVGERIELELAQGDPLRTYDFRIEPGRAGSSVAVTAVGFDISPSKHAELELRDSDRRKDEFLATLSHELRNPLTPLRVAFEIQLHLEGVARVIDERPSRLERGLDHAHHVDFA